MRDTPGWRVRKRERVGDPAIGVEDVGRNRSVVDTWDRVAWKEIDDKDLWYIVKYTPTFICLLKTFNEYVQKQSRIPSKVANA